MRYRSAVAVTPSDSANISGDQVFDALRIATAGTGTLRVTMEDGAVVDLTAVTVGILTFAVKKVHATGTGVSAIHALKI